MASLPSTRCRSCARPRCEGLRYCRADDSRRSLADPPAHRIQTSADRRRPGSPHHIWRRHRKGTVHQIPDSGTCPALATSTRRRIRIPRQGRRAESSTGSRTRTVRPNLPGRRACERRRSTCAPRQPRPTLAAPAATGRGGAAILCPGETAPPRRSDAAGNPPSRGAGTLPQLALPVSR